MPFCERRDCFAKQVLSKAVLISLFFILCSIPLPPAFAATANLAWDPSTGSNIAGYKMYYGTSSKNYTDNVNVGKNTSCSISGLTLGKKYYFAVTAYDTSNTESGYSSELAYTIPSGTVIIDNDGPGTWASGTWSVCWASGYYGTKSVHSKTVSSFYIFKAARTGAQDVYIRWTNNNNRYTEVPVKIYDDWKYLDKFIINQSQNAGKWNLLGTYTFSGTARVVVHSVSDTKTTSADAVKFVPSSGTIIIDNGDSGTAASGTWKVSGGPDFYGTESLYSVSAYDSYSFEAALTGVREVYLWWTEYYNRCTNVRVKVYDGADPLGTFTVDQRNNGGQWNPLGTFSFSGMAKVKIISSGGCSTSADAVNFFEPD